MSAIQQNCNRVAAWKRDCIFCYQLSDFILKTLWRLELYALLSRKSISAKRESVREGVYNTGSQKEKCSYNKAEALSRAQENKIYSRWGKCDHFYDTSCASATLRNRNCSSSCGSTWEWELVQNAQVHLATNALSWEHIHRCPAGCQLCLLSSAENLECWW